MKKIIVLCLTFALSWSVLVACEQPNQVEMNNSENHHRTQDISSETYAHEELEDSNLDGYESIIKLYREIAESCPVYVDKKDSTEELASISIPGVNDETVLKWYDSIFYSTYFLYPRDSYGLREDGYKYIGYTVKDLNKDNSEELILRLNDDTVIAVFTMVDGVPVLVGNYWNRYTCWIDADGLLHTHGSSGADRSNNAIYDINSSGELVLLWGCGTDGCDEHTREIIYYKMTDGEKHYITKDEYNTYCVQSPYIKFEATLENPEFLTFVPMFNDNYAPEYTISQAKG